MKRVHIIVPLLVGLGLLLALHTHGKLLRPDGLLYLLWLVPPVLLLHVLTRDTEQGTKNQEPATTAGFILLACCVLALFSSLIDHKWFYLIGWTQTNGGIDDIFKTGVARFVLITALLAPFLIKKNKQMGDVLLLILLFSQFACLYQMWHVTGGAPVYRDDHPSFIFRLWEFSHTFPQLYNYTPYWNGGRADHYPTSSGVNALGTLLLPLLKTSSPDKSYTFALMLIYIIGMPWLAALSVRMMNGSKVASYAGAVMALGVSRYFFLWFLHYGTVGASFAVAFLMPVAASLYRVFYLDKREKWVGAVLVLSMVALISWPAGAIVFIALVPGVLIALHKLTLRKFTFFAICAALFFLLFSKELYIILAKSYTFKTVVVGGIQSPEAAKTFVFNMDILKEGWHDLCAHLREGHPLLIYLGLGGCFFLPKRSLKLWFVPAILTLAFFTGWGEFYFDELQLRRMSIPLFLLAVLPASLWIGEMLDTKGVYTSFLRAALVALIFLGGLSVSRIYHNQTLAPYQIMPDYISEMVTWLKENTSNESRILFAGATSHKYGRAHVAALPLFTGREMMACDYYAFSPKEVEYEYPPREFRKVEGGNEQFFDLYGVSHIITYKDNWIDYFSEKHADLYEEVYSNEKGIHIFAYKNASDLFLKGSGEIDATFNRIDVELDNANEEAVIKYTWEEGLTVKEPSEIFPYPAHEEATFIGIRPNGASDIAIRFKSWL